MVIVHLSDNQRRVISSEKGETIAQLCNRFCKEFNYPISQFEFYSISTNLPLPHNLSVNEVKEVRLMRKCEGWKGSQDSCYSSIDEKSLQSFIKEKSAAPPPPPSPHPAQPQPPPQNVSSLATPLQLDRIVKRNAPPPPTYKLSADTTFDDADIFIPAPPSDPIPQIEMEPPLFVACSVDCRTDRLPSPHICLLESNNSSSIDSSEADFDTIGASKAYVEKRCTEITVTSEEQFSEGSSLDGRSDSLVEEVITEKYDTVTEVDKIEEECVNNNGGASGRVLPIIEATVCPQIEDKEEKEQKEDKEESRVHLRASQGINARPSLNEDSVDQTDNGITNPVRISTNYEPAVVTSTVPIAPKKQFWEPVKTTKQFVFTSRKSTVEDALAPERNTATADTTLATATVHSATADTTLATATAHSATFIASNAPLVPAKPVKVVMNEQVFEKTSRPEFVPVKPKSLFFSAGTK